MKFIIKKIALLILLSLFIFTGCSIDENGATPPGAANNLSLGVSANDLLSDDNFTSMKLEILYVEGFEPSPAALEDIKLFLQEHTNKPGGISIIKSAIASPQVGSFSISEINKIEEEHRVVFNSGEELGVFIFFADDKSATQEEKKLILGTAYKNTSMVIFGKTIKKFAETNLIPKSLIEATAMKHEFGHLFGLVDNGSPAQSDHEDPESESHCDKRSCLMNAEIEFGFWAVKRLKNQESIVFDHSCLLDLQANGGK